MFLGSVRNVMVPSKCIERRVEPGSRGAFIVPDPRMPTHRPDEADEAESFAVVVHSRWIEPLPRQPSRSIPSAGSSTISCALPVK